MRPVVFVILAALLLPIAWFYNHEPPRQESKNQLQLPVPVPDICDELQPKKHASVKTVASATVSSENKELENQWLQQQYNSFAGQMQKHLSAYPLTNSADFWLIKHALSKNDLPGAMAHLNAFLLRAQPAHLRFVASYVSLLVRVIDWLKTCDEKNLSESIFTAIADKDVSKIERLRKKYVFIPGYGLSLAGESDFVCSRELLLQQLMKNLSLALTSQDDLIKLLYDYTRISEHRCVLIRYGDKTIVDNNSQNFYPDVSQYERLRYQVRTSTDDQTESDLNKWFDDFFYHWDHPNIPFCLHGGRLSKIGNTWLCKYHSRSYVAEIASESLRFAEILTQYTICHPDVEIETTFDWLDQQ